MLSCFQTLDLGRSAHMYEWPARLTSMNDENPKMHFKDIEIMKVT